MSDTLPEELHLSNWRVIRLAPRGERLKLGLHHVGSAAVDALLTREDAAALRDALTAWLGDGVVVPLIGVRTLPDTPG